MKRIISLILVIALCFTLFACGKKSSERPFDYDLSKYITLGQYTAIEYTYSEAPVTDEAVTDYINAALSEKGYGETKEITNRPIQNGDTVNIDFEGKIDGKAFEGGSAKGYDLVIGSNSFIEGFESKLIGVKKGKTVDLDLKFPEDYGKDDLNGKAVVFTVTVNKISATVYPELTDKIVAEVSDKKTVAEYKEFVKTEVAENNKQAAIDKKETDIWSKVVANTKVLTLPEKEIENYEKLLLESYDSMSEQQYGMTYEEFLKQAYGKTLEDEEIKEALNTQAKAAVKEYMTIVAIARAENLDLTDDEYQKKLEEYAKSNGYPTTVEFEKAIDKGQFYLSLLIEKVMDFVVQNAKEVK